MKKSILNLGKSLNKAEQQSISGGFGLKNPCPPSSNFVLEEGNNSCGRACSYPTSNPFFPGGRCYGSVVNDACVVNC
ncbi:hypothetical protein [uncultured Tenacibaculum sp.]|uniref:hypothetical protein n=1 Tax=uncultured Tenacibaculum sp. TaxID=174713 RepID=UPI0026269594|nr:hypothetical protein [uncultured Tenacibaculum sp.]